MMAAGHVVTGVAAGMYVTSLAQQDGTGTLLAGALVCAGASLLPDLDHPGATAAAVFGETSRALAGRVARVSRAVHGLTRSRWDRPSDDGHRTLTHTLVFAVLAGALAWALARVFAPLVVFPMVCLALRGSLGDLLTRILGGRRRAGTVLLLALGAAGTWSVAEHLPARHPALWLGAMVALGCFVHCLGDSLTLAGCPWLWPVPILGRRWYPIGSPRFARFRAGGRAETWVVLPLLTLGALVIGGLMVAPRVLLGLLP